LAKTKKHGQHRGVVVHHSSSLEELVEREGCALLERVVERALLKLEQTLDDLDLAFREIEDRLAV
jgi:hypothetical protein